MSAHEFSTYGGVSGVSQFWLDDLACTGNETYIEDCPDINPGISNCIVNETAGVECSRKFFFSLILLIMIYLFKVYS